MTKATDKSLREARIVFMMSVAEQTALDAWRFQHGIGSRAEAIRRLVVSGMQKDETEELLIARLSAVAPDEAIRLACGHPLVSGIEFQPRPRVHLASGDVVNLPEPL